MDDLLGTLAAAVVVFAGTNIDDIIVLTVLFLAARAAGRARPWQIWAGQYAGIDVLVAVSAASPPARPAAGHTRPHARRQLRVQHGCW